MKLSTDLTINDRHFKKGENVPWFFVYPFFLVHMLMFGGAGFFMAYAEDGADLFFQFLFSGFAIVIYLVFYLALFGVDRVRWMLINAGLGLFGIYAQIDVMLSWFGKRADDYPVSVHIVPFLYYVLYTFLLYHVVLELTGSTENPRRRRLVEGLYVGISLLVYGLIWLQK